MKIKVVSALHGSLLYSIEDAPGFPHHASWFYGIFDDNCFKFVCANPSQSKEQLGQVYRTVCFKKPPGFNEDRRVEFRLAMHQYMNVDKGDEDSKRVALRNLDNLIRSIEPIQLLKDRAMFVILANMEDRDVLSILVDHCTLRKMAIHSNLIEWLFTKRSAGKSLRKLFLENIDDAAYFSEGDIDTYDIDIIDKLVMFRKTQKLLLDPIARSIFFRLLRAPFMVNRGNEEVHYATDLKTELDPDNDTGHFLSLENTSVEETEKVAVELEKLKGQLRMLKGNNLAPFEVFISVAPIQLTIGDPICTELFRIFEKLPSDELNQNLRPLVYLQWSNIYWMAFINMILYWIFASICYAFFGYRFKSMGFGVTIICMSATFLVHEFLTIKNFKKKYFKSSWNNMDLILYVSSIVLVPLMWFKDVETQGWAVGRAVVLGIIWMRALSWLRIFRSVRYLIKMVLRVFADMVAWLVVLASSIIGFSFIWRLSYYFGPLADKIFLGLETMEEIPSFFTSLQTVTFMMLGSMPNTEDDSSQYTVIRFIVAVNFGVILSLALANLLIAVINKTYGEIEGNKEVHDLIEVIGLIVDFSGSFSAFNRFKCCNRRRFVLYFSKKEQGTQEVSHSK